MTPVLSGLGLAKSYGRTAVLRDASLKVDRGESVAVMGPSGSGKSTLLYCLSGVLTPESGVVVFDGVRVDELPDARRAELRRSEFGFVFQFAGLLPELLADENVALPLMLAGTSRCDAVARVWELFPALGLDGLERRRPGELSGGQAQRVAIARALILQPAVVFADEPTGALDTKTGDDVMSLLVSTVRERQAALVVVTHIAAIARLTSGATLGSISLLNPYSVGIVAGVLVLGALALLLADRTTQPALERASIDISGFE